MKTDQERYIVSVNAGSSSIKLAAFTYPDTVKAFDAAVTNIGQSPAWLVTAGGKEPVEAGSHTIAASILLQWLRQQSGQAEIAAVGHRIVHGGPKYHQATAASEQVIQDLRQWSVFDPEHLPIELELVETFRQALPEAEPVLCFDTAFHYDLPVRSRTLPVPRHLADKGVRRYGFHGLSYSYIMDELRRTEGREVADGRVIIAHLGSGASLSALHGGKPVDTTMSMTPSSGIPMSTRSGDLDPGLMLYLARTQGYDTDRLQHLVNFESGLLGISDITPDMEKLLELEDSDVRAREAVEVFCYNVTKTIGSFAAALGGLDTLFFTGGMAENAPKIRAKVCLGLEFLGITLDASRNHETARLISADGGPVDVYVIHTDESVTIAHQTSKWLKSKEQA